MLLFDQRYVVRPLGSPSTTHPCFLDSRPFRANTARVMPVILPQGHDVHSSRLFSSPSYYLQFFSMFYFCTSPVVIIRHSSLHHPSVSPSQRPYRRNGSRIPHSSIKQVRREHKSNLLSNGRGTSRNCIHCRRHPGEKYFLPSDNNRFCCFHAA